MATLLGHTVTDGEVVRSANDTAPFVGLGRIITKMVGGVYKYKVEFLNKVKFSEPSQDDNTKGENLEFGTSTIEGQVATLANGDWSVAKTFDTMDEAKAYLEAMFTAEPPVPTTYTVTFDVNGGTGTLEPETVEEGESITLPDGTGITPPDTKTFAGWATTSDAVAPDVTSPYTPTANITLYAVYTA